MSIDCKAHRKTSRKTESQLKVLFFLLLLLLFFFHHFASDERFHNFMSAIEDSWDAICDHT